MAIVKKRIKGRYYLYEQHSKREGKKVKTTSRYIGPMEVAKAGVVVAYAMLQIASLLLGAYKRGEGREPVKASDRTVFIGGLAVGKSESAEECFAHESGWGSRGTEKSAPDKSAEAATPSA